MVTRSVALTTLMVVVATSGSAAPSRVSFVQSALSVNAYDFVEVSVNVADPDPHNPFTDVSVRGSFEVSNGGLIGTLTVSVIRRTGRFIEFASCLLPLAITSTQSLTSRERF